MDLEKLYNEKYIAHWAEELETGDKCLATIRHKTDGSKNLHNIEIIVIENNKEKKEIIGWFPEFKATIPYNELLKMPSPHITNDAKWDSYSDNEIRQRAKDFIEQNFPKWEKYCTVCGACNCENNKSCIKCNCQF